MNVLRSFARNLWNVLDVAGQGKPQSPDVGSATLNAARQRPVPPVLALSRFRDGFEQLPQSLAGTLRTLASERASQPRVTQASLQRDGFEGSRRAPVDLSGGVRAGFLFASEPAAPAAAPAMAFSASLADLSGLF